MKIGEIYSVTYSLPMIESTQLFVLEEYMGNNSSFSKYQLRPIKSRVGFSIPLESVPNISVASDDQIIECLDDMVKWQLLLK